MDVWFFKVKNFQHSDLVMSRTIWVQSKGITMIVWVQKNLKAYTSKIGGWMSWSYQKDDSNEFFNPLICLSTNKIDKVEEDMIILVKGKN